MAYETIQVEQRDGYRIVTLDRPDVLNAFNETMHGELRAALTDCAADHEVRALLLTGNGRGFCAGQDLSDRSAAPDAAPPDLGQTLDRLYNPLVRQIRALEMPVVCAVNGVAAGAGANIALACDLVLAARSARFIQAFAKIGLVPDCGGTWALPRLVGEARARGLALLATPLGAEQAAAWGLIWAVHDDDRLAEEAQTLAAHLAQQPTRGLALAKQALQAAANNDLDAQLDLERDLQRQAGATEDYREGVAAFLGKRPAQFKGR